ncbi:hypothetical protein C8A05DRAFT_30540 [Staphylotrichum tortipilum]|uniref:Modin n=1 Tax=Staphylotrichum tortipilum TaxID=2831512 RepID=A0AAN6MRA6_9PEZI|nr:hypothetical protein C8A05DRAFT_30540 [Staphylotrichum longicolle]
MSDNSSSNGTDTTGVASLAVAIVALVVAVVALVGTTAQVLQQYLATAVGYSNCGRRVMGAWARYTKLIFHPWELRFEVVFSSPEIWVLPADSNFFHNKKGGVVGLQDLPDARPPTYKEIVRDEKTGIADYSASWLALLSTLREMEQQNPGASQENVAPYHRREYFRHRLTVGVTPRTQTLDLMPEGVKKPYATTTLKNVVQLAALMGLHWKEFDRTANRYVADGNGLMMTGSAVPHLGIMFTFACHGWQDFGVDARVIPECDITELCFGIVPSVFIPGLHQLHKKAARAPRALHFLKLGSRREIASTLAVFGCDRDTAAAIASAEHLFPVLFELLAMLTTSIRKRHCPFRTLPNPLPFHWDPSTFSPAKLLDAFARHLEHPHAIEISTALSAADPALRYYVETLPKLSGTGEEEIRVQRLHDAIEWCTAWLRAWEAARSAEVVFVVRAHLEAVAGEVVIGVVLGGGGEGGGGVLGGLGAGMLFGERDSDSDTAAGFGAAGDIDRGGASQKAAAAGASSASPSPAAHEGGREARLIELYFRVVPPRIVMEMRELRQLMEKAAEGTGGGGLGSARRRREEMQRTETRAVIVWLVVVLRMLCWMNLHTFHPDDVQMSKSDLVDSRLPVYIS